MTLPVENRRKEPRAPLEMLVQHGTWEGDLHFDYASDVSDKGLFIRTERTAPVGSTICVQFARSKTDIPTFGLFRVARVTSTGIGAEFISAA